MFYGNADDFKTYLSERGQEVSDDWMDEDIDAALLVASEWLDSQYEDLWIGYKVTFEQDRSWPRRNAMIATYPYHIYSDTDIPNQVIQATYEAAKRELTKKGSLMVDYQPTQYQSVSIYNAVTVEYKDSVSSAGDIQVQIPVVQNLMSILIDPNKGADGNGLSGRAVRV
ncbi:MAG: hypothetical protein J6W96_06125 [Alphaproteobacteria bacterium]|nr:hypothetical protein [Alphaproteobacteria bacterium]